jgi:hypothetical protein
MDKILLSARFASVTDWEKILVKISLQRNTGLDMLEDVWHVDCIPICGRRERNCGAGGIIE